MRVQEKRNIEQKPKVNLDWTNHFVSEMFVDSPNKHDLFVINTRTLHLSNLSFRKQKVA